jgi:hypothetical protein
MKKFIVVAFRNSFPYIMQKGNVLSGVFYNNSPKPFKTLKTAKREAIKTYVKYQTQCVKVYEIDENTEVSSDMFKITDKTPYQIGMP